MNPILSFLKRWNELWLVIGALLLWPLVPYLLRFLDPTAAPFDAGVLHPIYVTMLVFGALHAFVWIGIKLNFQAVWHFFQDQFLAYFNHMTPCQKVYFCLSVFALYLFSVVLTFMAVAGMA
ncbi:hypothetical protein GCM10027189_39240 [Rufibacter soli]